LSAEEILNHNKSIRKTRKRDKVNSSNKEKKNKKAKEEKQLQKMKFPPIIYDPDKNQRNILLAVDDNSSFKQGQELIIRDIKEITNYYLELHKNILNTCNSFYFQILQNNSSLSWDVFFSNDKRFTNYPFDMKIMYTSLINNRDESLKLIDNIITNNLDAFITSIELTQNFYKDIIQSYLNCVKK
jgi:hypothetical protein